MASRVQKRRGNKSDHNNINTGAESEIKVANTATRNFTANDGTRG